MNSARKDLAPLCQGVQNLSTIGQMKFRKSPLHFQPLGLVGGCGDGGCGYSSGVFSNSTSPS